MANTGWTRLSGLRTTLHDFPMQGIAAAGQSRRKCCQQVHACLAAAWLATGSMCATMWPLAKHPLPRECASHGGTGSAVRCRHRGASGRAAPVGERTSAAAEAIL